eukprot:4324723-Pyramimonas_sp.AAC.1
MCELGGGACLPSYISTSSIHQCISHIQIPRSSRIRDKVHTRSLSTTARVHGWVTTWATVRRLVKSPLRQDDVVARKRVGFKQDQCVALSPTMLPAHALARLLMIWRALI